MILLNYSVLLCSLLFLRQAYSREPLVNSQGRFTLVDNVKIIGLNDSIELVESKSLIFGRANRHPSCRGTCRSRNPLTRRDLNQISEGSQPDVAGTTQTSDNEFASLNKRVFTDIADDRLDTFLQNRFGPRYRGRVIQVYDPATTVGNSAEFRFLEDAPVEMGVTELCGCTIVVVISNQAVWFAHFFENISFGDDEMLDETVQFFQDGWDSLGGILYQSLQGISNFFPVDGQTRAYIMTPQKERDTAVPEGTIVTDPNVYYLRGQNYPAEVRRLRQTIKNIIPRIPITVCTYPALNKEDKRPRMEALFYTRRGKALFQYDPRARQGARPSRGTRLYFQGVIVRDHFWTPENRLLSEFPSAPPLSCAAKIYDVNKYTCYNNNTLCPVLEGIPTLLCGDQCYLQSLYTCYDEAVLCPIVDGKHRLACGLSCYLPTEYSCSMGALVQLSVHDNSTQSTGDIIVVPTNPITQAPTKSPSPSPSSVPGDQITEAILDGVTYTIGPQLTTIVEGDHTVTVGNGSLIIGSDTITVPSIQTDPVILTTDGVTITFKPGTPSITSSRWPSSSFPSSDIIITTNTPVPGPNPTSIIPSSTTISSSLDPPFPTPTSLVTAITAYDGSSTQEITYTPTTFSQLSTLTSTSTITINIGGVVTSIVVGPGGTAWSPVTSSTTLPGFPPVPMPTNPPEPQSSSAIPPRTTSSTIVPFPSTQFPLPIVTTAVVTSDSPGGPVITTITGTIDPSGSISPITTLSTAAAIRSARSLASKLNSVSDVVASFSSSTTDSSKGSSATAAVDSAESDTNGFGGGLGFSLPGLCLLFCGHVSSAGSILDSIKSIISAIIDGSAREDALTKPLNDLADIADALFEDVEEASENDNSPTSTITTAPCSTGTPITNCAILCATGTSSGSPPTTSCFSTTCSVEILCTGSATTSTALRPYQCPLEWPTTGGIELYSYEGYTSLPEGPKPTDLPEGDDNGEPITTSTTAPPSTSPDPTPLPSSPDPTTNILPTPTPAPPAPSPPPPPPVICGNPRPCDAVGCAGTVVNNKATCKAEFANCDCIPNANTPGFSCGNPQSCESNNCAGKFANGKATCTNALPGCICNPTTRTPGFSCGIPQSCEANDCRGTTGVDNVSTCKFNFAGCNCIASKSTPGLSSGENLILADCGIGLGANGGSTSREMMYFPGDVWKSDGSVANKPTMMVNVPWDGSYPWRLSGVSVKFPNGDKFTVTINPGVKDPSLSGYASHIYNDVPLYCYSFHKDKVYQLDDKKWCSSAYVCNHSKPPVFDNRPSPPPAPQPPTPPPPTPQPQEGRQTVFTIDKDYVRIYSQTASMIFSHLRTKLRTLDCDTTPITLNAQCSISFTCEKKSGPLWLTTLAEFLITEMPKRPGFANVEEYTYDGVCKKWDSRPGHEGECLAYTTKTDTYLYVPETLDVKVQAVRVADGGVLRTESSMGYRIACKERTEECRLCRLLNSAGVAPWGGLLYTNCEKGCS